MRTRFFYRVLKVKKKKEKKENKSSEESKEISFWLHTELEKKSKTTALQTFRKKTIAEALFFVNLLLINIPVGVINCVRSREPSLLSFLYKRVLVKVLHHQQQSWKSISFRLWIQWQDASFTQGHPLKLLMLKWTMNLYL